MVKQGIIHWCIVLLVGAVFSVNVVGENVFPDNEQHRSNHLKIYLDADLSGGAAVAGHAIEQGISVALSEVDFKVGDVTLEIVRKDHRGSTPRSKKHIEEFLSDDQGLLMFGGLHSPPLLANKDYINANEVLTLVPWAAAGPITRSTPSENWVFRLSIDDSRAGAFISERAVNKEGFKKPFLILEQTGWGKSNLKTMMNTLEELGVSPAGKHWFNWNLGVHEAKLIAKSLENSGADVVFFVGNAPEGKIIIEALMGSEKTRGIPIRSHWGITGGSFYSSLSRYSRSVMNLEFIQTDFSFLSNSDNGIGHEVVNRARQLFPDEIHAAEDIHAPTGFIHAYDLTKLLISTLEQVNTEQSIRDIRKDLKRMLEDLPHPVKGLIGEYKKPFSTYDHNNTNAHEALSPKHYAMGFYDKNGVIHLNTEM